MKRNAALLRVLLHDIREILPQLEVLFQEWASEPLPSAKANRLQALFRNLIGGARLAAVELLTSLLQALHSSLPFDSPLSACNAAVLKEGTAFLRALPFDNVEQFDAWEEEQREAVERWQSHLSCKEEKSAPPATTLPDNLTVSLPPSMKKEEEALSSSLLSLFANELQTNCQAMTDSILALEEDPTSAGEESSALMRAAHSIKGAARAIEWKEIETLAHAMEDFFTSRKEKSSALQQEEVDAVLHVIDQWKEYGALSEEEMREQRRKMGMQQWVEYFSTLAMKKEGTPPSIDKKRKQSPKKATLMHREKTEQILRIDSSHLNSIIGLSGEALVRMEQLDSWAETFSQIKQYHETLFSQWQELIWNLTLLHDSTHLKQQLKDCLSPLQKAQEHVLNHTVTLNGFLQKHRATLHRLYHQSIESRMRPFSEGTADLKRLVRDLSKESGKQVAFSIVGEKTKVDREVLEKLKSPLIHLLRNAVDHGIEKPDLREKSGKSTVANLLLSAKHKSGMLFITVEDDGEGVNLERVKRKIVEKGLATSETAEKLSTRELIDFLFLPDFSTSDAVTDISGRGAGLDVVHTSIQEMGGALHCHSEREKGTTFHIKLPLTLSILRSLLVFIDNELYAFPLIHIDCIRKVSKEAVEMVENRHYIFVEGKRTALVPAHTVLQLGAACIAEREEWSVVIVKDHHHCYGLIVDSWTVQKDLVVHPLDSRLGKVPHIYATSLTEEGLPILILDPREMARTVAEKLANKSGNPFQKEAKRRSARGPGRILLVDDSPTVCQIEKEWLEAKGYRVDMAHDGIDGWLAVKMNHYDLVVTDIDMPRMNGISLIGKIRSMEGEKGQLPILVVSYKDQKEDRLKAMEAGANGYLCKKEFCESTFLSLLGELV